MSFRDARVLRMERRLKTVFDRIDDHLEDKYGRDYPLHPARPRRGTTSNKEYDGLFNVGAVFSAGYGTEHGRGYVVEVQMATLADVPDDVRDTIEREVVAMLREELPKSFPNRELHVNRDGHVFKIYGDLRIGRT
jgi:hypothetical protein